jgi:hypothetical protein
MKLYVYFSVRLRDRLSQPPIEWVKRLDREADHSPPTIAEVKKTWVYISTSPYVFMA